MAERPSIILSTLDGSTVAELPRLDLFNAASPYEDLWIIRPKGKAQLRLVDSQGEIESIVPWPSDATALQANFVPGQRVLVSEMRGPLRCYSHGGELLWTASEVQHAYENIFWSEALQVIVVGKCGVSDNKDSIRDRYFWLDPADGRIVKSYRWPHASVPIFGGKYLASVSSNLAVELATGRELPLFDKQSFAHEVP
jgi:hypothetical protein